MTRRSSLKRWTETISTSKGRARRNTRDKRDGSRREKSISLKTITHNTAKIHGFNASDNRYARCPLFNTSQVKEHTREENNYNGSSLQVLIADGRHSWRGEQKRGKEVTGGRGGEEVTGGEGKGKREGLKSTPTPWADRRSEMSRVREMSRAEMQRQYNPLLKMGELRKSIHFVAKNSN